MLTIFHHVQYTSKEFMLQNKCT